MSPICAAGSTDARRRGGGASARGVGWRCGRGALVPARRRRGESVAGGEAFGSRGVELSGTPDVTAGERRRTVRWRRDVARRIAGGWRRRRRRRHGRLRICGGTVGAAAGVTLCTATRTFSMSESTSSSEKLGWPRGSLTSTFTPSPSSHTVAIASQLRAQRTPDAARHAVFVRRRTITGTVISTGSLPSLWRDAEMRGRRSRRRCRWARYSRRPPAADHWPPMQTPPPQGGDEAEGGAVHDCLLAGAPRQIPGRTV